MQFRRCKFGEYCNYMHSEKTAVDHVYNDEHIEGILIKVEALEIENGTFFFGQ